MPQIHSLGKGVLMQDLCFTTYVHGWYQDFIPTFIFSALHEFPQHFVKIFVHDKLSESNQIALDLVSKFNPSFSVVEQYSGVDCTNIEHLPVIRYLLPQYEFEDFKYIYFGDVDFIIVNEHDDDFVSYYVNHCNHTKLPFSNAVTHDNNKHRMTGLHFVETTSYYNKMEPQISDVIHGNEFSKSIKKSFSFDEEILYYMTNKVFDISPLEGYTRPHNGVHLGYSRLRPTGHSYAEKTKLKDWKKHIGKINKITQHPVFKQIMPLVQGPAKKIFERVFHVLYRPIFL